MNSDAEIFETASRWRLRLEQIEPQSAEARELERWLASDPRHRDAFRAVAESWDFFDEVAEEPALQSARASALSALRRESPRGPNPRQAWPWRAAAGVALAAGLAAVWLTGAFSAGQVYSTGPAQRLAVRLEDGSSLVLDKDSRLTVAFTPLARRLTLDSGQARFSVAHNRWRPFTVTAQARTVVATGTAFNVDNLPGRLSVALYEGRVRIEASAGPLGNLIRGGDEVVLSPGQAFVLQGGQRQVTEFDRSTVAAWESDHLVFEDTPLSIAVARINRYTERKIELDSRVADLKVSGVFNTGDAKGFVEAVTAYLPLEAERASDGSIRLSPKAERKNGSAIASR